MNTSDFRFPKTAILWVFIKTSGEAALNHDK